MEEMVTISQLKNMLKDLAHLQLLALHIYSVVVYTVLQADVLLKNIGEHLINLFK